MKKFTAPIIVTALAAANTAAQAIYINNIKSDTVTLYANTMSNETQPASKWMLLAMPAVVVMISLMFIIYRGITGNRENFVKNRKYEDGFFLATILAMCAYSWVLTLGSAGVIALNDQLISFGLLALGLLIILMSNFMGKIKQQRSFGIKTKATLSDENIWRKTHRLSGLLGVISGVITILCAIVGLLVKGIEMPLAIGCLVLFIVAACLIPTIYAHVLYKKTKDNR